MAIPISGLSRKDIKSWDTKDLSNAAKLELADILTPKMSKYIPHTPTPKQAAFLLLDCREAFYGGAAGGGKSDALLMAGLQYVDVPGYAGIIFRKSYADLTKPGALIDRAKEWLHDFPDCRWVDRERKFVFYEIDANGKKREISTLQFGYLDSADDKYNYQGGEYQFIGFDELTHIDEDSYRYLYSRLRRLQGSDIPLRIRSASNPPDDAQGLWVRDRFIVDGPEEGRIFIPAGLDDNPHLDTEEYKKSLEELDPVTRARLRDGDWTIVRKGNMFRRDWMQTVSAEDLPRYRTRVRFWDMAATEDKKRRNGEKPDYTVGLLLSEYQGMYYIEDIVRRRLTPAGTDELQRATANRDGYDVAIREEVEPGSSGLHAIETKQRKILKGFNYEGIRSTGSKVQRAQPASAAMEQERMSIVAGCRNMEEFFMEIESFPGGGFDDMVDALSGAFSYLDALPSFSAPVSVGDEEVMQSKWSSDEDLAAGYFSRMNY